jgi:hypothetical protein
MKESYQRVAKALNAGAYGGYYRSKRLKFSNLPE